MHHIHNFMLNISSIKYQELKLKVLRKKIITSLILNLVLIINTELVM